MANQPFSFTCSNRWRARVSFGGGIFSKTPSFPKANYMLIPFESWVIMKIQKEANNNIPYLYVTLRSKIQYILVYSYEFLDRVNHKLKI